MRCPLSEVSHWFKLLEGIIMASAYYSAHTNKHMYSVYQNTEICHIAYNDFQNKIFGSMHVSELGIMPWTKHIPLKIYSGVNMCE